jgi:hypothetical protein
MVSATGKGEVACNFSKSRTTNGKAMPADKQNSSQRIAASRRMQPNTFFDKPTAPHNRTIGVWGEAPAKALHKTTCALWSRFLIQKVRKPVPVTITILPTPDEFARNSRGMLDCIEASQNGNLTSPPINGSVTANG